MAGAVSVRATQARRLLDGHLQQRMEAWAAHGAADGVDYRYPLLDRRLLEFCFGLPPDAFAPTDPPRPLLRAAMAGLLPDPVRLAHIKAEPTRVARSVELTLAACRRWQAETLPTLDAAAAERFFDVERLRRAPCDAATPTEKLALSLSLQRQIQVMTLLNAHG
jgi:asparagine synthase (glutamine-hydrolysing)